MMFIDEVIIDIQGGKGGDGCVAWRREKGEPRGGPFGGDGGRGGNVILLADENTDTLSDFASKKRFAAKNGEHGSGKCLNGHAAEDLILHVPPGTIVSEYNRTTGERIGKPIADLQQHGDQIVIAHGGKGGFGNAHFKSSTRQAPDFAELGEPGEKRSVAMELKLVADVGIIGYPSVGKSSLIAAVSSARPKIAEYHFTTLVPNLGVVQVYDREFVLCDVPGLIEGASEGKGLGDKFLKHIERCGILIHMLDINRDDLVADYKMIRNELKAYSPTLTKKKEFVVLNKVDLVGGDAGDWEKDLKKAKIKVFASISAASHRGTKELMQSLLPFVMEEREKRRELETADEPERDATLTVLKPHLLSERMGAYRIVENKDGSVTVTGRRLEQFTRMTDFSNQGAVLRFGDVLKRIGLQKALEKLGAGSGTTVFIGTTDVSQYL
jgi:GTP-binding protein